MAYFDELVSAYNEDTRHMVPFVEIYFDGEGNAPEIYTEDVVVSFHLLEEAQSEGDTPVGIISANELSLVLANDDRRFSANNTTSPLYGKLLPNVMVKAYLGIFSEHITSTSVMTLEPFTTTWEAYSGMTMADFIDSLGDERLGYVPLGTFWTRDWSAVSEEVIAEIVAYDAMYKIGQYELVPTRVQPDTDMYELFTLAFNAAGIPSELYNLDIALQSIPVDIGWLPKGTLRRVLQDLAEASGAWVFVDRESIIQVQVITTPSGAVETILTDDNQLLAVDFPAEYLQAFSVLTIDHHQPYLVSENLVRETTVEVPSAGLTIDKISFSKGPVAALEFIRVSDADITPASINLFSWYMDLFLDSSSVTALETDLLVRGKIVDSLVTPLATTNSALVAIIGERELHIQNHLIQNESFALGYLSFLEGITSNPSYRGMLQLRGNPALELGMKIQIDYKGEQSNILIKRNEFDYTGGLSVYMEGIRY